MKSKKMAAVSFDPRHTQFTHQHGPIIEEIQGLIKVYKDGHVERPQIMPSIPLCSTTSLDQSSSTHVISKDVIISKPTNLWSRIYVTNSPSNSKLPILVYFHGGGFCVGSASWICYHTFLSKLALKAKCVVISVNYRLAPENPLPSAYEDGFNMLAWVKQQSLSDPIEHKWWLSHCDFSSLYLAGDSAGANIAYNVVIQLELDELAIISKPLFVKGVILIQPFFGGESRTVSERHSNQPADSALTLAVSDTYWRLALPLGANRDHPWCNPLSTYNLLKSMRDHAKVFPRFLVCVAEMDILKDRNLEFCGILGRKVEVMVYKGVGHAFQVLNSSQVSALRTQEMISHIQAFINQ